MNEEMYLDTTGKLLINNFKPSYTIEMRHGTGEVSKLDFNGPKLIFTGDAEESAKVFFDYLAMIWEQRLQEEREAEREAVGNIILDYAGRDDLSDSDESLLKHLFELIRARGET